MLPKGSIAKIYKCYFTTPLYSDEIFRAMREFFDRPDLDRGGSLEIDEKSEGLFNDRFLHFFNRGVGRKGKKVLGKMRFQLTPKIAYDIWKGQ